MATTDRLYDPPRVGGDILFHCTRCKMDLAHVIISMLATAPAKIQCKTCKSERKYKRAAAKKALAAAGGPRKPRMNTSALWEEKLASTSKKNMQDYSPKGAFKSGDVLTHKEFGVGIVEEERGPAKILVLFQQGERILVHGMK